MGLTVYGIITRWRPFHRRIVQHRQCQEVNNMHWLCLSCEEVELVIKGLEKTLYERCWGCLTPTEKEQVYNSVKLLEKLRFMLAHER